MSTVLLPSRSAAQPRQGPHSARRARRSWMSTSKSSSRSPGDRFELAHLEAVEGGAEAEVAAGGDAGVQAETTGGGTGRGNFGDVTRIGDALGVTAGPRAADEQVRDAGLLVDAGDREEVGLRGHAGVDEHLVHPGFEIAHEDAVLDRGVGDEAVVHEGDVVRIGDVSIGDGRGLGAAELQEAGRGDVAVDVDEVGVVRALGGGDADPVTRLAGGGVVGRGGAVEGADVDVEGLRRGGGREREDGGGGEDGHAGGGHSETPGSEAGGEQVRGAYGSRPSFI